MNTDFVESGHIEGSDIIGGKIGIGDLQPDGRYMFQVNEDGSLYAQSGVFSGNVKATTITANSININNGVFSVTPDGFMTCTSGSIGGWDITPTTITKNNLTLDSSGSIYCKDDLGNIVWEIKANGDANFEKCDVITNSNNIEIEYNNKIFTGYNNWLYDTDQKDGIVCNNVTVSGLTTANTLVTNYLHGYNDDDNSNPKDETMSDYWGIDVANYDYDAYIDILTTKTLSTDIMTTDDMTVNNLYIGMSFDKVVKNGNSFKSKFQAMLKANEITASDIRADDFSITSDKFDLASVILNAKNSIINSKEIVKLSSLTLTGSLNSDLININGSVYTPNTISGGRHVLQLRTSSSS